jgi:glutamate carboxypeptidase
MTDIRQPRLVLMLVAVVVGAGLARPAAQSAAQSSAPSAAPSPDALRARVSQEQPAVLDTLRELVNIESGSGDYEGLTRIGDLIATRLRALGATVEQPEVPTDHPRFENTPPRLGRMVLARFTGRGTKRILLLAHMDTVYQKGQLAQQPFRLDGDRAYGLGIADDKHGVAVILHVLSTLRAMSYQNYGLITVLINADEEVSSAGSRRLITQLGKEHDVVFSCEGAGQDDHLSLATAGMRRARERPQRALRADASDHANT